MFYAEPDGKEVEVELTGGDKVEAEHSHHTPVSPCCAPNCSCICHLQRPGMKLIWVPVNVEDVGEEGGEEDEEDWEDEEVEFVDEGDSEAEDTEDTFAIEEDASLAITRSGSPPVPPKRMQSPQIQHGSTQNEEENIYEATLPLIYPTPKNNAVECKELDIPLIKVCKLGRRSKLTNSLSDPTSEFQKEGETIVTPDEVPPAIPPRIPLNQDSRSQTIPRGGIPLPMPTPEEGHLLRPSSPSGSATTGLSPQRAHTPPPHISLQPQRLPPPPPKADPRRLSTASAQSLTLKKGLNEDSVCLT